MQGRGRGKERGGDDEGTVMRAGREEGERGGAGQGRTGMGRGAPCRRAGGLVLAGGDCVPLFPRRTVSLASHSWSFRVGDGA